MLEALFVPFVTILIAEFLDKSQLSVLLLASKTRKHTQLLLGVMLAFLLVDGSAIFFGSFVANLIPEAWLKLISGGLFFLFGILSLRPEKADTKHHSRITHPLIAGFLLVFLSEWGDKTQLASALFATRYPPLMVLGSVLLALFLLSVMAVLLSKVLLKHAEAKMIRKVAGFAFVFLGIIFLLF